MRCVNNSWSSPQCYFTSQMLVSNRTLTNSIMKWFSFLRRQLRSNSHEENHEGSVSFKVRSMATFVNIPRIRRGKNCEISSSPKLGFVFDYIVFLMAFLGVIKHFPSGAHHFPLINYRCPLLFSENKQNPETENRSRQFANLR